MKIISCVKRIIIGFFVKFMPVNKKRICFTSFGGHYSDNPKYISQKIREMNKNIEIVWLVHEKYLSSLPEYVKGIDNKNKFARTYYSLQKDIVRLADVLGHSNVNTTRIYTTEAGDVHRKHLQKLGLLRC